MTTIVTNAEPELEYQLIDPTTENWKEQVLELVKERKPLKFSITALPTVPTDLYEAMIKQHYVQYMIHSDKDERFLVAI